MGYSASDYTTPDQQRGQYPYGQMYNVPSQQATSPTSPYDPVQQPYPRQNAAIEVLTNQFSPVAPPYYETGEGGPTSSSATALASSQYGYTTQQSPVGREPLATAYSAAGMTDPHQATSSGGYAQARYDAGSSNVPSMEASYEQYQTQLKQAFQHIRDGRLHEAGTVIFSISEYLLNSVEQLGLVRDEENTHAERLKMWEEFNDCWLTALQRQKEMLRQLIDSGQRPQPPQSLMEYTYLEQLGDTLVKACDSMEKHGLVDYQMGVWEEEIIAMLTSCLELWEQAGATPSAQRAGSATSRRR
jgi:enamine deaminase RidA (YjgF/YER057c/UK114 family)